jgi:hypothetical protein
MAAINLTISLDELREFVPKFVNATKKEVSLEMRRQGRLLVAGDSGFGLVSITAPQGDGDSAKAIGDLAVRRDISKVFAPTSTILGILRESGKQGDQIKFRRDIKNGNLQKAKDFINGQAPTSVQVKGYVRNGKPVKAYSQTRQASVFSDPRLGRIEHIADEPSRMLHQSRRGSRGKVGRPQWAQIVLKKTAYNQYVTDTIKRVGLLKAGWAKAADQANLGVSVPRFVRNNVDRAMGKGRVSDGDPYNMFVELTNETPVASTKINKGSIQFLLNLRKENILAEFEKRVGKVAKTA